MKGIQGADGISAYITTNNGILIAHSDAGLRHRNLDLSNLPQVAARKKSEEIGVAQNLDGGSVLSSSATIPRMNWLLFVEQPIEKTYGPVYDHLIRLSWLFVLGLVLSAAVGTLLARRMTVPIKAVQAGAARLAAGDFNQEIKVRTGDEIEILADEFNRMAGQLRESTHASNKRSKTERAISLNPCVN